MQSEKPWINKKGEEVHPDMVRVDEKIKDELVRSIMTRVEGKREDMISFKSDILAQIQTYIELLRDEYGLDPMSKSRVGNFSLQSFDGMLKIQIAVSQHIEFDEKLTLAKEKIDTYLKEITKDAGGELKTLIMKVFEVDKKGNINAKQVLSLKSYDITHPIWLEAMDLIDKAVEIVGSKSYLRFYRRDSVDGKYEAVSLDFSSI